MSIVNEYALNNALCLFKKQSAKFNIIPGSFQLTTNTLHRKYKKHVYEFALKIHNGELKKINCAVGFGYIPDFINFLEQKYKTKKLLYIK